jgi:hypothetical protein
MPACKEERSFIKLNDRFSVLRQAGLFVKFFFLVQIIYIIGCILRINGIDHFQRLYSGYSDTQSSLHSVQAQRDKKDEVMSLRQHVLKTIWSPMYSHPFSPLNSNLLVLTL